MDDHDPLLSADLTVLLVDVQQGFLDLQCGDDGETCLARYVRLLRFADWLSLPVIATLERPVETKGAFPDALEAALPTNAERFEKSTFDCLGEPAISEALEAKKRRTVAVAGGETDVCVLLTVLSLLRNGYRVHVLEDCLYTSTVDPSAQPAPFRRRSRRSPSSSLRRSIEARGRKRGVSGSRRTRTSSRSRKTSRRISEDGA